MGLLRAAAHAMFGDRVPSNEERVLRRQAKQLRRRAKWANRLSKDTAATRMLNQQAIQLALAYETIREQRYRRLAALYTTKKCECKVARYSSRADCSRSVMMQLQQQLLAYQPPQQYNITLDSPPQYTFYPAAQQEQQQHQSPAAVAAMPVTMQSAAANQALPAPPAYSGPAFAHYPTVFRWSSDASSPTSVSSNSSLSSVSSSASSQSQLQEPWLKQGQKQTVY